MTPPLRLLIGGATTTLTVLFGAATAFAHIDPDPKEAPAGSEQSVGFTVEHGCDDSPTIQLDMRLPAGVTNVTPEPPAGWTATVAGDVVTFAGGPLPADVEGTFRVRMTLPATPGATIYFPFVQRCEAGEVRWIDVPEDGSGGELEEPAPAMRLLEPLPTTAPPPTEAATTTGAATTTTVPATTTSTSSTTSTTTPTTSTTTPATTTPPTTAPPTTVAPDESGGNSAMPVVIAGVAAGGIALGGVATWQLRKRRP